MGESLFSSEPISLRMDRRSPEAVRLREAICKKLWEFLGDYSDDVLADYIVVLVCNGKHQNQARDDLQAFLGEQSGTFVAWLWDYLSQEFISKATPNLSNLEVKATNNHSNSLDRDYKKSILADHDAQSVSLSKDKNGSSEQPSCHTTSNNFKPSQMMERLRPCSPNLDKRSLAVNTERLNVQEIALQKRSGSNNVQILKSDSSTVPSQCLPEPKTEQTAICLRSVIAEEHQLRPSSSRDFSEARLPSTAMNDLSYQTARLRGNVWDRLGKPCVEDKIPIKEEQRGHLDLIDTGKLELLEEYQNPRLTGFSTVASAISNFNKQSYTIDRGDAETVKLSGDCRTSDKMVEASTLKRKGHMCELNSNNGSSSKENFIQDKGYSQHQRQSFLVKQNREQSVNKFARVADKLVASDAKIDLINPGPDCKATVVFKSQVTNNSVPLPLENLVPVSTTLPVNSKSQSIVDGGNANKKPVQEDVLAVKSRLRQIEMDMLKLRSNQVVLSTDGGKQKSSVLQNLSKEVMESRTVLVANVHFAATKESLVSHFGKCGTIVKVIMLTDAVTALPKGAAYIVFANKESVDRAISLSGTSLFSRILKVIRKAEVPPDFLVPSQPALKQLQPFYPQPYGKIPVQKPPTSSHLQWRRIPSSAGESSLTASSNGRGPSNSVG
ncbi:uncharacterized protein LOC110023450 isoform X2 [Phalaenopsis equestris]|uniref:uncharacterized protein LOC110023450 isoform X2 n=1 Tax=Phalaenopsis equestris TaxID=78828 RepID=UPI0009E4DB19|nr:uncharacterized protein LOC110023450 isoform X2 [Phalaenopsis equestris]